MSIQESSNMTDQITRWKCNQDYTCLLDLWNCCIRNLLLAWWCYLANALVTKFTFLYDDNFSIATDKHCMSNCQQNNWIMTSRSWQYISCLWDACSNHFAISDFTYSHSKGHIYRIIVVWTFMDRNTSCKLLIPVQLRHENKVLSLCVE